MDNYCPHCGEELELTESKLSSKFYKCPDCEYKRKIRKNDGFDEMWGQREKELN